MPEIYVAWSPGLEDNENALRILKESGAIAGIEGSFTLMQQKKIQGYGLKASLHNPIREIFPDLVDMDLPEILRKEEGFYAQARDADFLGFHAGMRLFMPDSFSLGALCIDFGCLENIAERTSSNLEKLEAIINKNGEGDNVIVFEPAYFQSHGSLVHRMSAKIPNFTEVAEYVCGQRYPEDVFSNPFIKNNRNIGYLLDIGHVTLDAVRRGGGSLDEAEGYIKELIDRLGPKIYEVHLKSLLRLGNPKVLRHAHAALDLLSLGYDEGEAAMGLINEKITDAECSRFARDILMYAIEKCPNLKIINLEINMPEKRPEEYAAFIAHTARYVNGIITSVSGKT